MRSAPSRRGVPVPSASWALMMRRDWSAAGCAWKAKGIVIAEESEIKSKKITLRPLNTKKVLRDSEIVATRCERGVAYAAHSQDRLCYWRSERVRRWYQMV